MPGLLQIAVNLVVFAVVVYVGAYLIPGISVKNAVTALVVAAAFAVLNILLGTLLTWMVTILTIPVVIITIGLFSFLIPVIVNAILLKIAELFIDGFEMEGLIQPFLLAIMIGLAYLILGSGHA